MASPEYKAFMANASRKARRIDFWRIKGTVIIAIIIAATVGGYFIGSSVYRARPRRASAS